MLRLTLLLIASALVTTTASAAPKVHFRGSAMVIKDGGRRIELADVISPHPFHKTIHAVARKGSSYFIVFGSSEFSRGWPPRGGKCGCGIESFIRWIHVQEGKIVATQEGAYVSCLLNRDGWHLGWKDQKLVWGTNGSRSRPSVVPDLRFVDIEWTYDPAHPEAGIKEIETENKTETDKTP